MGADRFSVIIPSSHVHSCQASLVSIRNLKYDKDKIEVIVVEGANPSAQRNEGARRAKGDFLYFVDDDSCISPNAFKYARDTFEEMPEVDGIGGPSLLVAESRSTWERSIGIAMGSAFALGPVRRRVYPSGLIRVATENDLILSNLVIRKSAWVKGAGFDPRLYPNEENEFINRVMREGCQFIYHPLMTVSRRPRTSVGQLMLQMFRYGLGRAKHIRINGDGLNGMLLLPMAFVLYIILSVVGVAVGRNPWWQIVPAAAYANLLLCAAPYGALSGRITGLISRFACLLIVYPIIHVGYGVGMLTGFITLTRPKSRGVLRQLLHIKCFDEQWTDSFKVVTL